MRSVTVLGQDMRWHKHICVIYDSRESLYNVVLPYLKEGYDQKEQLLTIIEDSEYLNYRTRLTAAGIPAELAQASGQLALSKTSESYGDAKFDPKAMLALVDQALSNASKLGFSCIRTCGDMNWCAEPGVDKADVMRYEAEVNAMVENHDCTCMCAYDISRFPSSLILDILATHPVVVMNGRISENPYYVPLRDFLPMLDARHSKPLIGDDLGLKPRRAGVFSA